MTVVIVCVVLLLAGVTAVIRWLPLDVTPRGPQLPGGGPLLDVTKRYWWWVAVAVYTGVTTGVFVVGPAGRLAMRILAVTGGDAAQGRETEAQEVVGRITSGGTIGLFLFVGLFFGLLSSVLYLVIRRWLPRGLAGGLTFGVFLLAVLATRVDPLRRDNADFDLVGPGWLAILIFATMAVLQAAAIVAFAGRISHALPEPSQRLETLLPYAPLLIMIPTVVVAVALLFGFGMTLLLSRRPEVISVLGSRASLIAGRVVLLVVVLASLPGTIAALTSIAGRP